MSKSTKIIYNDVVFGGTKGKSENTLNRAWEIRNFEIDLYWKRALYFWGFIALAAAGYFSDEGEKYRLFIACVGVIFSVAWYLVNKASKFWQENWECHIDCLENDEDGKLYKTVMHGGIGKGLLQSYPFSVSKINQFISLFVIAIWSGLLIGETITAYAENGGQELYSIILPYTSISVFIITVVLSVVMVCTCRTSFMKDEKEKNPQYPFKEYDDFRGTFYYERKKNEDE